MTHQKINRNDPCPCGSGKKYKQCCQLSESTTNNVAAKNRLLESVPALFKDALKYQKSSNPTKAEEIYQQILVISPKHSGALHNLGVLAYKTGKSELAIELLRKAVQIEPSTAFYCSLSQAFTSNQQNDQALECLHKAIALNPGDSAAYNNLGVHYWNQHRYGEAIPSFYKSITLNPQQDIALGNLASCFSNQGQFQEAAKFHRQAIQVNPHIDSHYNNLLLCLCFDNDVSPEQYLQEARRFDNLLNARATPYQQWNNTLYTHHSPLRVGLVSGDFRSHPVGYFLESIVRHMPSNIAFVAYDTQMQEDELTARIKPHFAQWHNIAILNDQQAAQKIHNDGIHILVDLAGHTANNRLSLFARKPAPIQVSWLGYFASTGLGCMDYFLADPLSVPSANVSHFTEKVWYLPHTRLCFTPPTADIAPPPTPTPALSNGFVTFGCFQSASKINTQMIQLWGEILTQCPNSRLILKNQQLKDDTSKQALINKLLACHLPIERVTLEKGSPRDTYFTAYENIDFMLDTFPYPGGTTTCEALWMGVPTLTLAGNSLLSRQGMSMLHSVGLTDWVATSTNDYVNKAITHAHNITALNTLRLSLRATMQSSPLVDAVRFSENLADALIAMWKEHTIDL